MQLHTLKRNHPLRSKKRIGRGGKRGTYSGRGIKGQKSRAGRRLHPSEHELLLRLPKLRGFKNKPLKKKPYVFNVGDLAKLGISEVSVDTLIKAGLIKPQTSRNIKILGKGEINTPLHVRGIMVSKSAKMKIEKAGGSVS